MGSCTQCKNGYVDKVSDCSACDGTGKQFVYDHFTDTENEVDCTSCSGAGEMVERVYCSACGGTGVE